MKNRRILSLLLGIVLMLCMLPSMAFAADKSNICDAILDSSMDPVSLTSKCATCGGRGFIIDPECELCEGSGDCPACWGDGLCSFCGGSGKCAYCNGMYGQCDWCNGTRKCQECGGRATCETCLGSCLCSCTQPCPDCGGLGIIATSSCDTEIVLLKANTSGNNAVKLSWNKVDGATKYMVYGQQCGKEYKKLTTTTKVSYIVKKISGKKLKAHKAYKFYVKAVTANGEVKSKKIHFITCNTNGKYANAKSISVNKKSLSLEQGETAKLKVTTKIYKDKKHLSRKHGAATRYISDNTSVVTVNSKGVVTAKNVGTANIYIQDIGGKYCKTTVIVEASSATDSSDVELTIDSLLKDKHLAVRNVFGGDPPKDAFKALSGRKAFLSEHMTMSIDGDVRFYYDLTFNNNGEEVTIPSNTAVYGSGSNYKCTSADGITCTFTVNGSNLTKIVVEDSKKWDGIYKKRL